jgi:hypothetical protein
MSLYDTQKAYGEAKKASYDAGQELDRAHERLAQAEKELKYAVANLTSAKANAASKWAAEEATRTAWLTDEQAAAQELRKSREERLAR